MGKASSAKKIQRVQRAGVSRSPGQRRALGFPALIIGILIVGTVLVAFARDNKANTEAEAPAANVDHWHTAFGVYDCDHYLPNLKDPQNDPTGIHTHGDGLIHIHPFVAAAAGKNAVFGVFADTVGMTIEGDKVTLPIQDGGQELATGATCKGEDGKEQKATLQMLVWPPQATDDTDPKVVKGDFADIRFTEDGEIFALALLPEGTSPNDVPLPPSVEQLKDPLAAEGGGAQQPTSGSVPTASIPTESIPTDSVPADGTATTVPAETPSTGTPTTTGG
jgi:hypothetical protein